mmetsp:Transcript_47644/g.87559  ORF Transcript_47644/g.87559 Transcript_47644/m.87559 type:complete len:209 (+) Transcript_47644:77-703(+)
MSLQMSTSKPKLLSSVTMHSTASTASTDSFCSGSDSPKSAHSAASQDAWSKESLTCLPQSYLPGWCVKNTFVDFEPCEPSARRRRASAPPTCSSVGTVALEDLRQQVCPTPCTTAMQANAEVSTTASLAPQPQTGMAVVVPMGLIGFPSIGSVGHYTRQCIPCAFIHTKGCTSGAACRFCHLCDKGEKKRRQKQKFGRLPAPVTVPVL